VEENLEPTTPESEDVEAHLLSPPGERPPADLLPPNERPPVDANTEGPDVELHSFVERPPAERPPAE
jgi:hypothetical protein